MPGSSAQQRNIRYTVFALVGVAALFAALFVRQFVSPDRLDPAWLQAHGAVLFDPPRAFDPPRLLDQAARPFDGSAFVGHWSVLFFGFTFCRSNIFNEVYDVGRLNDTFHGFVGVVTSNDRSEFGVRFTKKFGG